MNQDQTGLFTPAAETMMPKVLKPAGYVTSMVGKWGQLPLGPAEFGFDDYLKFKGSGVYWNTQDKAKTYDVNGKNVELRDKEYLPDVMHQHVDRLHRRSTASSPFYVYYSLSHVHADILPTPDSAPGSNGQRSIRRQRRLHGQAGRQAGRRTRPPEAAREHADRFHRRQRHDRRDMPSASTIGGRRLSGAKGSMLEGGALVPTDRQLARRDSRRQGLRRT